jgi:hypothetical protein
MKACRCLGVEEGHKIEHKNEKDKLKEEYVKIKIDYEHRAKRKI